MYLNMRKMENPDVNITVAQWLAKQDKDLKIVAFKRFTLVAD